MIEESERHEIQVPTHFCCCQALYLIYWTGPTGGTLAIKASSVGYRASNMARFDCLLFFWGEGGIEMKTKIYHRGSDLGHDDLPILGRNAPLYLATDLLGRHLPRPTPRQSPNRTRHSSLGSTTYVWGLSLGHLMIYICHFSRCLHDFLYPLL